jgi:hypothetical protein
MSLLNVKLAGSERTNETALCSAAAAQKAILIQNDRPQWQQLLV